MRNVAVAIAAPASAQQDWSKTVVATTDGGFAMGNPKAKVTLVEYGSLTCSHCREFHETGMKPLVANYVKTGKVSYEFRDFPVHGPVDIPAILLGRCVSKEAFFPVLDQQGTV